LLADNSVAVVISKRGACYQHAHPYLSITSADIPCGATVGTKYTNDQLNALVSSAGE